MERISRIEEIVRSPGDPRPPENSGTTAGRPATSVAASRRPVNRVSMNDSLTNSVFSGSSPRACSCAMRADVPVPRGERSNQPG
uniref:Proline racemase n=1 Tax=uncultured soil bacterium TaxID=164851 RepID=E2D2I1_9BACT|nr:proline racemase [uncultured soil bacterium]